MWIRSQDRQNLMNVRDIWVNGRSLWAIVTYDYESKTEIGTFPDTATALEELDRIDAWIEGGGPGVYQVRT